jgi:hypothetical protein
MSEKLTYDELHRRLAACPAALKDYWRHYKTGEYYLVTGRCISEATQEPMVLYDSAYADDPVTFCRPLAEWEAMVELDGKLVPRFTKVFGALHRNPFEEPK